MSCSPFDLRDYVLAELCESERRSMEEHALGCAACREELERLRLTPDTSGTYRLVLALCQGDGTGIEQEYEIVVLS